jgi:hypothetical protein
MPAFNASTKIPYADLIFPSISTDQNQKKMLATGTSLYPLAMLNKSTPTKRIINLEPNIAMGEISTMRRPHWLLSSRSSLHLGYRGWKP